MLTKVYEHVERNNFGLEIMYNRRRNEGEYYYNTHTFVRDRFRLYMTE